MNVVLFHIGRGGLPEYQEDCLAQYRLFNPDAKTYFITESKFMNDPMFKKYNIQVVNAENVYSQKISDFILYFRYSTMTDAAQFWVITALRLIYIENLMCKYKLKHVYHFENDIMLYQDISTLHPKISQLYSQMAITVGGPDKCMTGFMYISSYKSLEHMTKFFIDLLHKYDKKKLVSMYKMDMVNEMTLMRAYSKEFPENLQFLPILPFGEWSTNFTEFNSIFDPASWGQFVGGNAQQKVPECKPEDHYIGQLLRANPEYTVMWKTIDNRLIPHFKYGNHEVRINNLHIHSKALHLYKSNDVNVYAK